jgi:hypothetical protein
MFAPALLGFLFAVANTATSPVRLPISDTKVTVPISESHFMQTKFLLMFLAIGSISIDLYTYWQNKATSSPVVVGLTNTVAKLVELELEDRKYIEWAIERALKSKESKTSIDPKIFIESGDIGKVSVDK